jgi:hypothetical protein
MAAVALLVAAAPIAHAQGAPDTSATPVAPGTSATPVVADTMRAISRAAAVAAAEADSAAARRVRNYLRAGRWGIGALYGAGWPSAGDLNDRIELENLALASDIPPLESFSTITGAMRYGIKERFAFDLRGGYLWRTLDGGRVERKVTAIPIVVGVTAHPWGVGRDLRIGPYGGAGLLYDAAVTGEDPLGGVDHSGTGWLAEAGIEVEYALFGPSGTVRVRAGGEIARVPDLLGEGMDLELDGFLVQVGVLYYLAP